MIGVTSSFSKSSVSKYFQCTRKRKAGVFRFLRFEECFRKASFSVNDFSGLLCIDGWSNRRAYGAFSNFSGQVSNSWFVCIPRKYVTRGYTMYTPRKRCKTSMQANLLTTLSTTVHQSRYFHFHFIFHFISLKKEQNTMIILRNPQIAELIEAGCAFKSNVIISKNETKKQKINK